MYVFLYTVFALGGILIGLQKGRLVAGIVWSLLLGPFGWLIVALGPTYAAEGAGDGKTAPQSGGFNSALWPIIAVLMGIFALHSYQSTLEAAPADPMKAIHDTVTADAVAQYNIARQAGTPIDVCVQAGMVSAAFLQAKNSERYQFWKGIENVDCETAGVPR